ncbi:amidohydrolase family protein [Janibacter sp. YIM B02568]|uniref:amidohydrolase n=1 Tax=Janibacter endophyticus TaxID=2806261 RepID=UPI00194E6623|nr:amidohydrolase family protein [Janibacter endophyticus]MBM6544805.1 amidohydrolase family protein [Janibacter endophyticus]
MSTSSVVRDVRLVDLAAARPDLDAATVDLRITDGVITEIGPGLPTAGAELVDAGGRWAMPGLWDAHVHMAQWEGVVGRLDVSGTDGPDAVLARIRAHLDGPDAPVVGEVLQGFGFRLGQWSRMPSTAELDAVVGARPTVLISGDCHAGWLSTAAYGLLGVEPRPGSIDEDEWFEIYFRLGELPTHPDRAREAAETAQHNAAAKGVVGIVDMEFHDGFVEWPWRVSEGLDRLRVRPATYPAGLDHVIEAGHRTGDVLDAHGLVTMGPLKVISDGSLNTRTAWCCEPFAGTPDPAFPRGKRNVDPAELVDLMTRAHAAGLEAAIHAIGDAAVAEVLDAFEATGARGAIEHAQLVRLEDLPRMAVLGVRASVQPAHLLDDRDTSLQLWPDRMDRAFAFGSMRDAGVELRLGSDAPVSPLDPWLAAAAAVHRSADDREPWSPTEALTVAEALAASTDGIAALAIGGPGDLVLLDEHPRAPRRSGSAEAAARLRETRPVATLVAGRVTHST